MFYWSFFSTKVKRLKIRICFHTKPSYVFPAVCFTCLFCYCCLSFSHFFSNSSYMRVMNSIPKINSLYSDASILPRRISAALNRKDSSCCNVIFSLFMLYSNCCQQPNKRNTPLSDCSLQTGLAGLYLNYILPLPENLTRQKFKTKSYFTPDHAGSNHSPHKHWLACMKTIVYIPNVWMRAAKPFNPKRPVSPIFDHKMKVK